jgi:hypothetical protein
MGVLTQFSASLASSFSHANVTIHNEGVYIPFPSCALKLSNLEFKFYLPALTILNASYLLRTRAYAQGLITYTSVLLLNITFKLAH